MEFAVAEGHRNSVEVTGHLVEAEEVDGVISFLRANGADLLVIRLRQHSSYVARFWSTVVSKRRHVAFWQFMHSLAEVREKSTGTKALDQSENFNLKFYNYLA